MHWPPSVGPAGSDLELPPDAALTGVGLQLNAAGATGVAGVAGSVVAGRTGDGDDRGDGDGAVPEGAGEAARNRRPPAELLMP